MDHVVFPLPAELPFRCSGRWLGWEGSDATAEAAWLALSELQYRTLSGLNLDIALSCTPETEGFSDIVTAIYALFNEPCSHPAPGKDDYSPCK